MKIGTNKLSNYVGQDKENKKIDFHLVSVDKDLQTIWKKVNTLLIGSKTPTLVSDSSYTVKGGDDIIICNTTSSTITVNLPDAAGKGRIVTVKNIGTAGNDVTVDADDDTIEGNDTEKVTDAESITFYDRADERWVAI